MSDERPAGKPKSQSEISLIREVAVITVGAFERFESIMSEAVIEADDQIIYQGDVLTSEWWHEYFSDYFKEQGVHSPEGMIVSCGAAAAEPHHPGKGPLRAHQTIVVDLFPKSLKHGNFADMTRTYVKGQPTAEVRALYEAVSASKAAATECLRAKVKASYLYDVSANELLLRGYEVGNKDRGYVHTLGHGVGQGIHERPTLRGSSDEILEAGMVVTIEPGLYYPEIGGVRIEDTVLVTEEGYEILTNHPENWLIA